MEVYCGDDSTHTLGVPKQVQREGATKNIQGINQDERFEMWLVVRGALVPAQEFELAICISSFENSRDRTMTVSDSRNRIVNREKCGFIMLDTGKDS